MYSLKNNQSLVLASTSPRRRELLAATGLVARVLAPAVDEAELPGEKPEDLVARLSLAKAEAIAQLEPQSWVIGGDTIVALDGRILGKPRDDSDACAMLKSLQGRTHEVVGGLSVISLSGRVEVTRVSRSVVTMAPLSDAEIAAYVKTGEPLDKAGSYALQGIGSSFVARVEGSFTNVIGLDVPVLLEVLKQCGIVEV